MYALHQGAVVTDSVLGGTAGRAAASIIALLTLFGPRFNILHDNAGAVSATANKTEDVFPRYSETATSCSVGRSLILSSPGHGVVFSRLRFLFIEGRALARCFPQKEIGGGFQLDDPVTPSFIGALTFMRGALPPVDQRAVCLVLAIFR